MYLIITPDGNSNSVSADTVRAAVTSKRAVIHYGRGDNHSTQALYVYPTPEAAAEAAEKDTRGECYSVWDEVWGKLATDAAEALRVAFTKI